MSTVTTTWLVNLGQLAAELTTPPAPLSMDDDGTQRIIACHDATISQAQLQAAVDAHVAIDEQGNRTALEQQAANALTGNRTFLAIASPTNAQIAAQAKALTRQSNGVIRLLLGKLDATD